MKKIYYYCELFTSLLGPRTAFGRRLSGGLTALYEIRVPAGEGAALAEEIATVDVSEVTDSTTDQLQQVEGLGGE